MNYSQEVIDFISKRLDFSPTLLSDLINRKGNLYRVWYRKKGNKRRCVEEPLKELKSLQRKLLDGFFNFQHPKCVHGGVRKKSIRTNALEHKSSKYMLRLDIKNAYPSVTRKQIYQLYKSLGATVEMARILTKLTTFRGHLPQGAPTSLPLFNILLSNLRLDSIFRYSVKGIKYTRYVDDLIFTSRKPLPKQLESEATKLLKENGFNVNRQKTKRYSTKNRALRITGVNIIKGKPKLPPKLIKKFRGMIGRAIFDNTVSKDQVFGIIAFTIGIEKKIPNQLLKPFLRYLKTKNIKECSFVINTEPI